MPGGWTRKISFAERDEFLGPVQMTFVTRNGEDTIRNHFSQSDLHNGVSQQERDSFGYAVDTLPDYNSPSYRDENVLVTRTTIVPSYRDKNVLATRTTIVPIIETKTFWQPGLQ